MPRCRRQQMRHRESELHVYASSLRNSLFVGYGSNRTIYSHSSDSVTMRKFLRDNRGATLVEYALVALPVLLFIIGIMQTAWVVWIDNLMTISVSTAARCGAMKSNTSPCPTTSNWSDVEAGMEAAANTVFGSGGATFSAITCTNGVGLVGK